MAKIKPFCGFYYNPAKIKDISKVVCPPYDVINPSKQDYYHSLSPYNIIHLTFGKDIKGDDKYKRAHRYLKQWIEQQVLINDTKPVIYFYSQEYSVEREKKLRLGFIALLRLEDKKDIVLPHEHTRLEPKEDRLKLLKAVKANLSPIFVLFQDKNRIIRRTYEQCAIGKPAFIEFVDENNILNKLWKINEPRFLDMIQSQVNASNIFIADGHHRYEVSLMLRKDIRRRLKRITKDRDYNYIMAYFTNVESKGLVIFPVHRLVRQVNLSLEGLKAKLEVFFDIEEIKDKTNFLFLIKKSGLRQPTMGFYKDKRCFLLRLKNIKILDKVIGNKPKEFMTLEVSILNFLILKDILKQDPEDKRKVIFNQNSQELFKACDKERNSIVFILNSVKIEQMISLASKQERLPPKSTYFYPKVLSGLVINKFRGNKRG